MKHVDNITGHRVQVRVLGAVPVPQFPFARNAYSSPEASMTEHFPSHPDVASWKARIAAAAFGRERRGIAALIKPAALVAAVAGRLDLIETWLRHVPDDIIDRDPQLLYWSGVTIIMERPGEAQPLFQRALEKFLAGSKDSWSLLAWAGLVDCIFFLYRDLRELDSWIDWMTPEREKVVDRMPAPTKKLVVSSMLFALAFRKPNHPRIGIWRERAEGLIEADPTSDLGARLTSGLICDYTWRGNFAAAETVLRRFHARALRKGLSPLATILGHLNDATLALHQGRLEECSIAVEAGLKASATHNIRIWDGILRCHAISVACSRLELDTASKHIAAIDELFAQNISIDEAYYRGMLMWHAFLSGDHVGAVSRCSVALGTADAKGVPYLQAVCRVGAAIALFEAGHRERGEGLLEEALCLAREIDNSQIAWIGGLFRAHFEFARGNGIVGEDLLAQAMRLGRDYSLAHFFCWPRQIIAHLIDIALERGYSPDYARHLITVHSLMPAEHPSRSDEWAYDVRIFTLGAPRIEYADGRVEPLSTQFQRQLELLAALIGNNGTPTPIHVVAADVYPLEDVDGIGSIKRVLHSLRQRVGPIVVQRNATLALDFSKVWIDACSLGKLLRQGSGDGDIEIWLDRYYRGHFMDCIENSQIVLGIRRHLQNQVVSALHGACSTRSRYAEPERHRQFEARWRSLFPSLFEQ